ncbi:MAG TPA: 50S ribosomal protein L32 [Chloroflexota bacterium]|nr:50S ribosomal protein L32 [Chloroflexota bacterium]
MGAVPKERIPKSKQGKRRSHHALAAVHLMNCPQCKTLKLPHHVCPNCGTYKGRQVIPAKGTA